VVVVGAGLAGLVAARRLRELGHEVTVFEARDRVGGRILTLHDTFADGQIAEAGAEFVAPSHTELRALLRRAGLRLIAAPPGNGGVVHRIGRTRAYATFATPGTRADIGRFWARTASLPLARSLDARSAAWHVRRLELRDRARFLVEHQLRGAFGVEPENLSLLFLAQQARVGRGPTGRRRFRIRGGADQLPLALSQGVDVRLATPVRGIAHGAGGVTALVGDEEVDADACVLAVPVKLLASIEFEPGLPPALAAAVEHLGYGHAVKAMLQYDEPFWDGSGDITADLDFQVAWDATRGQRGRRRVLTAYPTGRNGLLYGSVSRRSRGMLAADEVEEVYPGSRALFERGETVAWHIDGWSQGSTVAYAPAQVIRFRPAIRQPLGRLHFAGEHTDELAGTMEGAVRSGTRVATAIARG
jgi:monoamine oxidase